MIRFNPCGKACDLSRREYRTRVRPFRDFPVEVEIWWYRVPRENGTLPFPTAFNNSDWEAEPYQWVGPGEVFGAERVLSRRPRPEIGPGDHICGTPDDFLFGCVYDPDLPPVAYAPDGLPECCRPGPGGVAVGGGGVVVPRDGAAVLGGAAEVWQGGMVFLTGEAVVVGDGGIVLDGTGIPEPPTFCDEYTIDPALTGPATLTRIVPGGNLWWNDTVGGVVLLAEDPVSPSEWTLYHAALDTYYYPPAPWDGTGCVAFDREVDGSGPLTLDVCCAD